MSSSDPPLASHFANLAQQRYAAQLGMWLFLLSEALLFAGLFAAYSMYRLEYPEAFLLGSHHLDVVAGTVNTVVLITSSFTVALSVHFAKATRPRLAGVMIAISILFAFAFLGIKGSEYAHHFHTHALPGRFFKLEGMNVQGSSLFFTLYFISTGLHGLHVLIGIGLLSWIGFRALKGEFSQAHHQPVELVGMYWHLVDLVWIFLFPLLYLI